MLSSRKKLIEVALPLEAINEASAAEKANPFLKGHPRQLHLWWARRPLAACRAVIFASLVDDPDDPGAPPAFVEACRGLPLGKNAAASDTPRQRLFDFIERLVLWESTTDEQVLETARALIRLATDGNPPPLLDPFAGGGSIPLEAQRLGLEAHASDLNPVAVMINKALIEIPPMFAGQPPVNPASRGEERGERGEGTGNREQGRGGRPAVPSSLLPVPYKGAAGLAADVRYYGEWMRERAWERIGHLYPEYNGETVIAWLWARTVKCPNPACGAQMPLVRSFDLSKKAGRNVWVEPHVDARRRITFAVKQGKGRGPDGTVSRRGAVCIACGTPVPFDHVRDEGKAGRMGAQLMAIVTEGQNGRSYYSADATHVRVADSAEPTWRPDHPLPHNPRDFKTPNYGMRTFADLFTPRQLVALTTFSDLVGEARERIRQDAVAAGLPDDGTADGARPLRDGGRGARAYAEAVSVYLAFALSRWTDYANTITTWNSTNQNMRNAFARQALPMTWDFAESNLFGPKLSFDVACEWITPVIEQSTDQVAGVVVQRDAAALVDSAMAVAICTDPPYYDNIGYADLSDFFYVWLRPILKPIYASVFDTVTVPKAAEMIASPYRFGGDARAAQDHFETRLRRAFSAMRHVTAPSYPVTVYYAFKQEELVAEEGIASTGWETMLTGLLESGFSLVGTWPMRTERSVRMVSLGTNALASSIVLVCRPRPDDAPLTSRREFVAALRRELPPALHQMQSGNIAPVDLAQASIGPGMAVYSRYSKVLEPNGQPLTVRTALQLINQALDEYLAEQEGELDEASRFAVAWFEQYGFRDGEFGVADVLARAKNTSVETMARAGFVSAAGGKVRLVPWQDLDAGRLPEGDVHVSVWEAVHYLVERFDSHGEEGAARLMARMPADLADAAHQLAYRLYSIAERKGWADYARDYNGLVVSWGASQQQALTLREHFQQGRLF